MQETVAFETQPAGVITMSQQEGQPNSNVRSVICITQNYSNKARFTVRSHHKCNSAAAVFRSYSSCTHQPRQRCYTQILLRFRVCAPAYRALGMVKHQIQCYPIYVRLGSNPQASCTGLRSTVYVRYLVLP